MLALALLGATGNAGVWNDRVASRLQARVLPQVDWAIEATANRILTHGSAGLIAFAALLSWWYLTRRSGR